MPGTVYMYPSCLFLTFPADPPHLHSFPTRRSSDLGREAHRAIGLQQVDAGQLVAEARVKLADHVPGKCDWIHRRGQDRKSTRLNSSHANISYAVFCLKKKNRICKLPNPAINIDEPT